MRKQHFYIFICLICSLTVLSACTDNGDETPVEAKAGVKETNSKDLTHKINSMLKRI
ncbi:MAG TPA: hypothetical protein VNS08_08585 [Ureibacillus sp.]|nr:hypothetical protein [Ureibacillus sp.]